MAWRRPYLPSLFGRGRRLHRTPVVRLPRPPVRTGVGALHASTSGAQSSVVSGGYDQGSHAFGPSGHGPTKLVSRSRGTSLRGVGSGPVAASIAVTTFCAPACIENAY